MQEHMRVTQHVAPEAKAKRAASSTVANLVMLLHMDWHNYRHLGMTIKVRNDMIAGLRDGTIDPDVVCETLGIPMDSTTAAQRDAEAFDAAVADFARAIRQGINILGRM